MLRTRYKVLYYLSYIRSSSHQNKFITEQFLKIVIIPSTCILIRLFGLFRNYNSCRCAASRPWNVSPYTDIVLLLLHSLGLWGSTLSWKLSIVQPRARRREGCRSFQYLVNRLNQTESAVYKLWMNISKGSPLRIYLRFDKNTYNTVNQNRDYYQIYNWNWNRDCIR